MKSWMKIGLALGATAAVSGVGAVLVYRSLTEEGAAFIEKQQDVRTAQARVDAAAAESGPAGPALSGRHTFSVAGGGVSNVTFTSDAPLETIVGNATGVSDTVALDLSAPLSTTGTIDVDIATFETGIALRDEHLQGDKWLGAVTHPKAVFTLKEVRGESGALRAGERRVFDVSGDFTLRGITRRVDAPVAIQVNPWTDAFGKVRINGDVARIRTEFTVRLQDLGIDAGALGGTKVAEFVTVVANLTAVTEAPAVAAMR